MNNGKTIGHISRRLWVMKPLLLLQQLVQTWAKTWKQRIPGEIALSWRPPTWYVYNTYHVFRYSTVSPTQLNEVKHFDSAEKPKGQLSEKRYDVIAFIILSRILSTEISSFSLYELMLYLLKTLPQRSHQVILRLSTIHHLPELFFWYATNL